MSLVIEYLGQYIISLSLPDEPQKIFLVEELEVIGLQFRILFYYGYDSAVDLVEVLPQS